MPRRLAITEPLFGLRLRAALRAARRSSLSAAVAVVRSITGSAQVAAHGQLILELGADRIQPGAAVEVRGDLGSGEQFEIALISKVDGSRRPIGIVPATDEGHFQSYVTVPADVTPGDYLVEASFDLLVVRAPLTVAGAPIEAGGEGPDQADGLVLPMPSTARAPAASAPGGAVAPGDGVTPGGATGRVGRSPLDGVIVVAAAIAGAGLLLGGLRLVRHRRGPAPEGRIVRP